MHSQGIYNEIYRMERIRSYNNNNDNNNDENNKINEQIYLNRCHNLLMTVHKDELP